MQTAGPLSGILVLDLTRVLAGPYCSLILADLGARVIKLERPPHGDDARQIGPFIEGRSAYFASLNRGKQSVAVDLARAADRRLFEALAGHADVLIENFRPGVMERLGYGWSTLHERFPQLIYAAASGFGHSGPYAPRPAYDMVVQGMGGIMSLTGPPGGPPTRVGSSVGDITAGLFTAIGVLSALHDRDRTGAGHKVDVAMLDCQVAILENAIARYQATGEVPGPLGDRHPSITPFGAFEASDGPLIIAAGNDALFRSLCDCLNRPALAARAEYASNEARTRHHAALRAEIEETLGKRERVHWLRVFEAAGVPCGPIQNVAEVLEDPQIRARNMVVRTRIAGDTELGVAGNPIKLSGFPDPATRPPPPDLDESRAQILAEFLGSDSETDSEAALEGEPRDEA